MQHSQAIIDRKPPLVACEQEDQGVLSVSSLQDRVTRAMLSIVPSDGSTIGNTALRREIEKRLQSEGLAMGDDDYWQAHSALVADGALVKGQGRGGSVRRAQAGGNVESSASGGLADDAGGFALQVQQTPELRSTPTPPKAPAAATRPTAPVTCNAAKRRRSSPTATRTSARTTPRSAWSRRPPIRRPARPAGLSTRTSTLRCSSTPQRANIEKLIDNALASRRRRPHA
jgi:adenine-specific DNA-methyltransferase